MGKEQETTKTSVRDIPAYVEEGGRMLINKGKELLTKPFESYTGPRVADFVPDMSNAFQKLRDMISSSPIVLPEALQGARTFASAPAQQVSTERVVDEGGKLGAISDYINPNAMAALMPALRKIGEAAQAGRLRSNATATMSGAFGDARHGVVESGINQDEMLATGDTTVKFMSDAFDKAMGARTADLNRFLQTDMTNAGYNETALNRLRTGSGDLLSFAGADQNRLLQQIDAMLKTGGVQQGNQQARLDADFSEFMRGYGHDYNTLQALAMALKGAPYDVTTTDTTTQPDNSGLGLIGTIAGQAIPALLTGGASLPFTMAASAPTMLQSFGGSGGVGSIPGAGMTNTASGVRGLY